VATTRKAKTDSVELEKSQVSLPPPGSLSRFTLLGGAVTNQPNAINFSKRQQYAIYYEMYRQHPVVHAAVNKKASFCAAGGLEVIPADTDTPDVDKTKAATLRDFLRRSNYRKLLRTLYKDLDIYGESFWLIVRSQASSRKPIKAMRLHPRFMTPEVTGGLLSAWVYGPVATDENAIRYDVENIIHFSLEDPESDVVGLSPLHPLQRAVAQDLYAMEYNEAFFKNSAQTGVIFIVKTSTSDEAKRNREWLETNYVGPENAHRPLLLEGDVEVAKSVASPQEMEFLEGRMFLRQEISMALDMDLDKLGIHDNSNRSTSKEINEAFHTETVWPRQSVVEEELNNSLVLGIYGWDDVALQSAEGDARRRMDQAEIWDRHQKMGRFTVNDSLRRMGLPTISTEEGGDVRFVMGPSGMIPLNLIEAFAKMQLQKGAGSPLRGFGSTDTGGSNQPTGSERQQLTRQQAEAVSQNEPK